MGPMLAKGAELLEMEYRGKVNLVMTILWAKYQYFIQIPNKRIFTGTFTKVKKDKTTIRVYLNKDPVILGL